MTRLAWMIRQSGWGWPGAAALCLLVLVALGHASALQVLQQRLDALQAAPDRTSAAPALRSDDPRAQLERFYRHFRESDALPVQLAKLHSIAGAQGIALRHGEYRLVQEADGRLKRYQITFPVQGPYPAVRKFIAKALEEIPIAALDQVLFERKRIGDGVVDAEVRFTLFLVDP